MTGRILATIDPTTMNHSTPVRRVFSIGIGLWLALTAHGCSQFDEFVSGDGEIRAPYANSEIIIRTTSRLAGAIDSLRWNGKEFIDSTDHGRQIQSASNFDFGSRFSPETFNPTEAGSRDDGAGATSTSRLIQFAASGNQLRTTSDMAFWLQPGERSQGNLAKNKTSLSNHQLTKRVTIGYRDLANVIQYDVTFGVPDDEVHSFAQFEAVTGYMPAEFSRFVTCDPATGKISPLSDGPGEQPLPVILSTQNGLHAMGVFAPLSATPTTSRPPGYGRWNFNQAHVVKWNCVFRYEADPIVSGDYSFRCFVIVGTLDSVAESIKRLRRIHPIKP